MSSWTPDQRIELHGHLSSIYRIAVARVTSRQTDGERLARVAEILGQELRTENLSLSNRVVVQADEIDVLYRVMREQQEELVMKNLSIQRLQDRVNQLEADFEVVADAHQQLVARNIRLEEQLLDQDTEEDEPRTPERTVRRRLF